MLEFSRMTLRNHTLWNNRHPEDKHFSKMCSDKFPACRLPPLEVAAEFQNQHDWNKTDPTKLNCFKIARKDPIGFHRPGLYLSVYSYIYLSIIIIIIIIIFFIIIRCSNIKFLSDCNIDDCLYILGNLNDFIHVSCLSMIHLWHQGKICHKLQQCPARNRIPNRQSKIMTTSEVSNAIMNLLSTSLTVPLHYFT